jgi:hypothetical protein
MDNQEPTKKPEEKIEEEATYEIVPRFFVKE